MRRLPFAALCILAALAGCNPDNLEPNPVRNPPNPALPMPTLTATTDTVPAAADALIRTSERHSNHGNAQTMMVKVTQSQDDTTRALVKFDQAAIAAAIGSGTLTRATLELGIEQSGTESENRIDVHRIVLPWTESGATWRCGIDLNTANPSADCPATKWRMSGADMDAFVTTRTDRAHLTQSYTGVAKFNVTADVQAFLGGAANHGWLVTAANATSRAVVWSRETAVKPRLVLAVERNSAPPVPAEAPAGEPSGLYRSAVMVPVSPNSAVKVVRDALSILFKEGTTQADRAAVVSRIGGTVIGGTHITATDGFYIVQVPDPGSLDSLETIIASLDTAVAVDLAIPEYLSSEMGQYRMPNDGDFFRKEDFGLRPEDARGTPWYLTAVNAPMAWGCSTGSDDTPIAVVDEHLFFIGDVPDLTPTITFHTDKFPGSQHGIKVASILAARGDNQEGMTGMMWSSNLRLYDVVELDPQTLQPNIDSVTRQPALNPRGMANRISQAIRDGARIINLSMTLPYPDHTPTRADTLAARRFVAAVQRTWSRFPAGGRPLLVIAAGNDGVDAWWGSYPQMETHFPNEVVVVGGSNRTSNALFVEDGETSNFGPLVSVAAPAEDMIGFDGTGAFAPFGRTSGATPLVSGTAGLLLAFDRRLTIPQLHDLVVLGAERSGRSAAGLPIIDAYESLKEAGQRPGAPLCGNRVWAAGGAIHAQRGAGSEQLISISGMAAYLNVFHGGQRMDWTDNNYNTHAATRSGTTWTEVDPAGLPQGSPGATYLSFGPFDDWGYSASHDGDIRIRAHYASLTTTQIRIQLRTSRDGGTTFTDTLGPYFESGSDGTTSDCYLRKADFGDDGTTFSGWTCRDSLAIGPYRAVHAGAYYYPGGSKALLVVNTQGSTTSLISEYEKCPWATVNEGVNTEECRSFHRESIPPNGSLYEVDLRTGVRKFLFSVPNRLVASAGVAETDDELMLIELTQISRYDQVPKDDGTRGYDFINVHTSTANCQAAWYRLASPATPFRIVSQDFCTMGFEGGGTIAPVRRNYSAAAPVIPGLILRPELKDRRQE